LAKELKKKRCGTIGISTVTDPYQPIEKKYRLTRLCLEQLIRYDFPIDIQTKSDLVLRDLDLISQLKNVEVGLTIPTLRDEERKMMEPKASSIEKRLRAVRALSDRGIKTYIFFGPAYPTIEIDEVEELVEIFYKTGTNTLIVDSLHLKSGVWENLEKNLPNEIVSIYRKRLLSDKDYYNKLFEKIKRLCQEYDLKFERAF
ncbi:MAG TPA: radical SAM protein, partial [Thermoplasmatales archaeon]|nr:radical SAM protein [Thermoplasmatales archaeon]